MATSGTGDPAYYHRTSVPCSRHRQASRLSGAQLIAGFYVVAWIAGVLEIAGGILLVLGLFTRVVAFVLSGLMAVAYFMAHAPQGFFPVLNGGELAVLYCFIFLYLVFAGPGAWSLDRRRAAV